QRSAGCLSRRPTSRQLPRPAGADRCRLVAGRVIDAPTDSLGALAWSASPRDGDLYGQAAAGAGRGGGGAAVDRRDGGDDGQAEPGTAGGRAAAEPLERLEDAIDIRR